jgi:hypothetical protein
MTETIIQMILGFVSKYPIVATILMVMGVLRAVNKPLFALVRAFVASTPSAKDDAILDKVEQSKIKKSIEFALDYLASVKLPGAK